MFRTKRKKFFICFLATMALVLQINLRYYHLVTQKTDVIEQSGRLLCWVMANPANEHKWMHLKNFYGPHCDKFIIMTSAAHMKQIPGLELYGLNVAEGRYHLAERVVQGFIYLHEKYYNDFDFFMRVDEDSFFIMENLRYLLYQYDPSMSLWIGEKFWTGDIHKGYLSGMGYIFTYEGLNNLYQKLISRSCPMDPVFEDQSFAKCLADVVLQVNTIDESRKQRFVYDAIDSEVALFNEFETSAWIKSNTFYHIKDGVECCSPMLAGTHHISMELMYLFNHLIRNVTVWSRNKPEHEPRLPKKLTRLEIAESALDIRF